ncbi:MAG TPA: DNA methyltransferase [Armatimonadota bacterium]|jgi:DNA modification methylase
MTDPRNRLNDLTNREWLQETKSFWLSEAGCGSLLTPELLEEFSAWLRETRGPEAAAEALGQLCASRLRSSAPPRSKLKITHPATFSERDIERIIRLFTHAGEQVLDPFAGSGSTLLAARACARPSQGIELIPEWADVARRRLQEECPPEQQEIPAEILPGDALPTLAALPADSADLVVTSPPYWRILRKKPGLKAQAERSARGLTTHYSEDPADLGNLANYEEFLSRLGEVFAACLRVTRPNKYLVVIVSDFRDGKRFVLYHADLAAEIERRGWALKGLTVLLQDSKNLYPFAIPYAFVSNIHHQYVLIFQKPR